MELASECCICLEINSDTIIKLPCCGQVLHDMCLDRWIMYKRECICPVCRTKLVYYQLPRNHTSIDTPYTNTNTNLIINQMSRWEECANYFKLFLFLASITALVTFVLYLITH